MIKAFLILFFWAAVLPTQASTGLLSIAPRSDFETFGLFKSNSTCQNNVTPSLKKLNQLKADGNQIAFITTGGASLPPPRYQIKDVFQGVRHLQVNTLIDAMEIYVKKQGLRNQNLIRNEVKSCLRGDHRSNRILSDSCTEPFGTIFAHLGIVVLNSQVHSEPYVIHFYTNKDTGWFRPAIRVETAASYLDESTNITCETRIILPKWSAQMKVKGALQTNLGHRMLAPGPRAYNLISNPWGLKTQNCNEWLAGFLASSLLLKRNQWSSVSRQQARRLLIDTGFTPTKIVLNETQSLAGLIAQFPGFSAHEGNINYFYGVGDGLPARSILEWLNRQGQLHSSWTIRGQFR